MMYFVYFLDGINSSLNLLICSLIVSKQPWGQETHLNKWYLWILTYNKGILVDFSESKTEFYCFYKTNHLYVAGLNLKSGSLYRKIHNCLIVL